MWQGKARYRVGWDSPEAEAEALAAQGGGGSGCLVLGLVSLGLLLARRVTG
eukprot:COSAG04_NODE_26416_length_295_cov_0.780612_1_plen_51_part_00